MAAAGGGGGAPAQATKRTRGWRRPGATIGHGRVEGGQRSRTPRSRWRTRPRSRAAVRRRRGCDRGDVFWARR
eukprot:5833403-Prymnesium_polylepis.1